MSLNSPRRAKSGLSSEQTGCLISEQVQRWREANSYWTPCRLSQSESKAWVKKQSVVNQEESHTFSIRCICHCCHFSCTNMSLQYISWLYYQFLGKPEVSKQMKFHFRHHSAVCDQDCDDNDYNDLHHHHQYCHSHDQSQSEEEIRPNTGHGVPIFTMTECFNKYCKEIDTVLTQSGKEYLCTTTIPS